MSSCTCSKSWMRKNISSLNYGHMWAVFSCDMDGKGDKSCGKLSCLPF